MQRAPLILIGERDSEKRSHVGVEASIRAYTSETHCQLPFDWVRSSQVTRNSVDAILRGAAGIWAVPGGFENPTGAILAIEFARLRQLPFLGTCGGFQYGLMEFTQNVLGRAASHEEVQPGVDDPLIAKLACSLVGAKGRILAAPEFREILGVDASDEEFHCEYGLRDDLEVIFDRTDLKFVARDELGQVRAFLLANHPFYVGTLFQPELRALNAGLHPVVRAFLDATAQTARIA